MGKHSIFNRLSIFILLGLFTSVCVGADGIRFEQAPSYQMLDIDDSLSYAQYRNRVRDILRNNWNEMLQSDDDYPQLTISDIEEVVAALTPTDRPATCSQGQQPRKMLLLHGLYDSPYVMHDLEDYFHRQCFHTRSILLPGHGTRPGNLRGIRYQHWENAVDTAIAQFNREVEGDLYLAGFSTGAALALNAVSEQPDKIKGLFLFAPALRVFDGFAGLLRTLGKVWVPYQKRQDADVMRYESLTMDSVVQVGKLADKVRKQLARGEPDIDVPVLLVIAENDITIKTRTAIKLYQKGRFGDQSEMLIYTPVRQDGQCVKRVSPGDPSAIPKQPTYIGSCFVHEHDGQRYKIADYSHMSLILKSTDRHYGLEGSYHYCTHYFHDPDNIKRCQHLASSSDDLCFGERNPIGAKRYPYFGKRCKVVRRLTSNPQFDQLTELIDQFIARHIDMTGWADHSRS
ncbi:MAG: alpha/beta fold hydrolase [Gammaproteobacteria bacterium]|nr:alpha/beta fold hydrolase [Gammaproteobacteria bacterium]